MSAVGLDLDLLEELVNHHTGFYHLFAYLFKCIERAGVFVESLINLTEFAFS